MSPATAPHLAIRHGRHIFAGIGGHDLQLRAKPTSSAKIMNDVIPLGTEIDCRSVHACRAGIREHRYWRLTRATGRAARLSRERFRPCAGIVCGRRRERCQQFV